MAELILGLAGALIGIGCVLGGYILGTKMHTADVAEDTTPEEVRREQQAAQKAFSQMMSYNMAAAYGMNRSAEETYDDEAG